MIGWWDSEAEVPNQLGAISTHPLHVDLLCSSHLCREGIPWAVVSGRDHDVCVRASLHDGEVWSSPRQVHGLLHDVPRLLGRKLQKGKVLLSEILGLSHSDPTKFTAGEILVWFCPASGCLFHPGHHFIKIDYIHVDILCFARRCSAKGCECGRGHDQDQAYHSVCGLVPNWLQVRHQLSAANRCARRWLGQGHACVLHDLQLHGYRGGLFSHRSQVRPHVTWQCS